MRLAYYINRKIFPKVTNLIVGKTTTPTKKLIQLHILKI